MPKKIKKKAKPATKYAIPGIPDAKLRPDGTGTLVRLLGHVFLLKKRKGGWDGFVRTGDGMWHAIAHGRAEVHTEKKALDWGVRENRLLARGEPSQLIKPNPVVPSPKRRKKIEEEEE